MPKFRESMNLTQIKAEILTAQLTNAELQELMETVQYARAQLGKSVKRQLQPGASVSFVSNRSGQRCWVQWNEWPSRTWWFAPTWACIVFRPT
jgi:hypothetical protein